MEQELVTNMADDEGVIDAEFDRAQEPVIDVEINIRQDDLCLFETPSNRLLLRTDEMDDGMYLEAMPTPNGVQPELVVQPDAELTELEPAEPEEQPDVSTRTNIDIRMD